MFPFLLFVFAVNFKSLSVSAFMLGVLKRHLPDAQLQHIPGGIFPSGKANHNKLIRTRLKWPAGGDFRFVVTQKDYKLL